MKLYKGRTKDVLALCTKRDFYTASFPPHRKHMAWRFFRLSGFGACFFVFHGGGLPCSSRGRQSCRRVASARAAETRGEREAPGTAPREDPLARAIASRLRAPASRLRAQASNTHTQQRRGAELRTPRRERNEKREKILLLLLEEDDGRFPCVPLPFALRLVAWRLSGVSRSRVVSYLAASCSRGAERERVGRTKEKELICTLVRWQAGRSRPSRT